MSLPDQIAKLDNLATAELAAEYERLCGRPPRYRSVPWLRKRIAYALQVAAFGGLSRVAKAAIDELNATVELPPAAASQKTLRPGTVLQREWRGQQIRVEVTDDGFVWNDETFGSLSAVAQAVTGVRWSGALFFKMRSRSKK